MDKTVDVLYFAALSETLGCSRERITLPDSVQTVAQLRTLLGERHGAWPALLADTLRCAVNQEICKADQPIAEGDEVAFFPPVTGG